MKWDHPVFAAAYKLRNSSFFGQKSQLCAGRNGEGNAGCDGSKAKRAAIPDGAAEVVELPARGKTCRTHVRYQ
jgi:hypothetical protein